MNDEQNHYCKNLIEVNKKQQVVTNQPIYNEAGILLLAQGAELNEKRAEVLLQHKLMKPLEQCVGISNSLNAKALYELLNKFAANIPELNVITANDTYQKTLRLMCLFYEKYPLLQQNLTVLALRAPSLYHQGLFSAMAGLAIALDMRLNINDLQITFIAGLFHDVGFLYLTPNLREKSQGFSNEEWKALQAHPLIAQRFLGLVPALPPEIGFAIADHHERIDGTGYPRHIFGDKISIASQIIAATDHMLFNHKRYQAYGEHTHKLLFIALKLNDNIYLDTVHNSAMRLLQKTSTPQTAITPQPSTKNLLDQQKLLQEQFSKIRLLAQDLNDHSKHPLVRSINLAMGRLAVSVVRSGILQPEQEQLIAQFTPESSISDNMALMEISVMHDQISDQLVHIKNMMDRVVEGITEEFSSFKSQAEKTLSFIQIISSHSQKTH